MFHFHFGFGEFNATETESSFETRFEELLKSILRERGGGRGRGGGREGERGRGIFDTPKSSSQERGRIARTMKRNWKMMEPSS